MSFINLMASDVWSGADITARTEAMLRAQWSVQAQTILSRKAVGVALGQFTLSPEEEEELGAFAYASMQARMAGESAEADMNLLREVLAIEPCAQQLKLSTVAAVVDDQGVTTNQNEIAADILKRHQAQVCVLLASPEARSLMDLRLKALQ